MLAASEPFLIFCLENGMKTLWQHENGMLYAVEHDSLGHITGATGPLDPWDLRDLDEYRYGPGAINFVRRAIQRREMQRVDPQAIR
jgi:hypothetical protein